MRFGMKFLQRREHFADRRATALDHRQQAFAQLNEMLFSAALVDFVFARVNGVRPAPDAIPFGAEELALDHEA